MGSYTLTTWFSERSSNTLLENLRDICPFEITMHNVERPDYPYQSDECTYLEDASWQTIETSKQNNDFIPDGVRQR
jgi:hypothetical protein